MKHLLTTLAAIAMSSAVMAQNSMPAMKIVLEEPTDPLAECGLTADGLRDSIEAAMRYNRIERTSNDSAPILYVQSTGGPVSGTCVINVFVQFVQLQPLRFGEKTVFGFGEICSKNVMNAGPSAVSETYNSIKQLIDSCTSETLRAVTEQ